MQRQVCGNCMEGKSAPPVMIPMSRSSRDYRASKNPKVSSEDTSSASAASKKSQIRASGSPTRSTPATKKPKTGGLILVGQNRLALAIETSCGRSGSATQPLRPASSRSKRAADANGDVTLETLRLSKKSKIGISLANGEASADDNEALIRKNSKSEGLRRKQATGTASQSKTSEATASDNALNALKLSESGAGSAGSTSHSEDTNTVGGSVFQISEGAVNAAGSSEPPELTEQRSLRPRPKPPVVKKVVKRTRFHEVSLGDSDGPHIVGRRIKVFWPLDKKWYYGSVKAYNSAKKQHKIIYDDHDEEWLKLQKESFRLEVLSGDAFGYAAPSSDLAAELVDSVSIAECDESNKHRGDAVDGSTSASDDKPAAERTGVRRSKVGRERESEKRRKVSEGVSEEGKKLDGPGPSEHRKKAGRVNEQKKKLEGDREPKKKPEGSAERGKKTDSAKGLERKRGDAKQRATKGEKLGRGNAKRAVLEVYERRKKRAQSVGTSGPGDRKGKGIAADGLNDRRKRAGKESSRKGSVSQTRTRHSATESTDGKKVSRRGIRDNDRLFASIKSSAVIRRKVAESKRSKDQKPVGSPSVQVKSSSVEDHEAPEDEEKVFPRPQAAEAGLELLTLRREERIARAANAIDPLSPVQNKTDHECGTVGSPVTSTVDVTNDEDDTTCEADSPTSVHDTTSDDKAKSEECTSCDDEALPSSDSVPSSRTLGLDEATGAMCGDQMSGEMVVCQRSISTTEHVDLDTESRSLAAECVERSPEEAVHIGCDADAEDCTLQSMDLRFEFPPSTVEESSNQEVNLDGPLYFGVGLEGPRFLSSLRSSGLGEWSRLRDATLQLGTYFGAPGVLSLLRVSRRPLSLFRMTHGPLGHTSTKMQDLSDLVIARTQNCKQTETLVGFSLGAVENNSNSCSSGACVGISTDDADASHGLPITRPCGVSRRIGCPGPLRRRRLTHSYNPYLIDPRRDHKCLSLGRQSVQDRSGTARSFERLLFPGSRLPTSRVEPTLGLVISTPGTLVQFTSRISSLSRVQAPSCPTIPSADCSSRISGAQVAPLVQRCSTSLLQRVQIRSALLDLFHVRKGSIFYALLDASSEAVCGQFPVASVMGESARHDPQGWGCREVGTYYGRRSLQSLLRLTIDDICTRCGFSGIWGYCVGMTAIILMVLKAVYESCKHFGFGVPYVSGECCEDLVRCLIRKLLADRVTAVHLTRFWGTRVVADLREVADFFDHVPGENLGDIVSRLGCHFCTRWPYHMADKRGDCTVFDRYPAGLASQDGFPDDRDWVSCLDEELICRCRVEGVLEHCDSSPMSVWGSMPLASTPTFDLHPLDARWRGGWIPQSLVSPEEMSMCAFTLSEALRRPSPSLISAANIRPHSREVLAIEGTALQVGRGLIIGTVPSVFVVLDKASYAAAGPVLLSTSATRILPEVYPRTMMRRCTDVGTYYGLPSIESFLRISADFWRRVFQKQAAFEEVNTDCALDSVPVVEEAMGGLFSQWPEVSSVDTVDDEDLSDTEDRLQISSAAEGPGVCESFNADISKKDDNGEDFDSMKASLDSQAQSAEGRRAGKGLKRGFVDASPATICDGADGEYPLGDDALSGRPYSKRTRAEIESSGAAVITDSVDTSSPSDVDGNGCPAPSSAAEPKADESSLPRVNVLKLRRCPTNKGLWRVAGNSCAAPQDRSMSGLAFEVRDTGDGAEPMTPVFETSRKRALDQCSESSLPGRNDQSGNSVLTSTFSSNLTVCSPSSLDQDMIGANTNKAFSLNSKSKEVWYDCGMTFMNEVAAEGLEPRKRRRKGPSPVHGDDVEALSEHSLRRSTDSGWVPCSANVLITRSDRCLRETGAIVELQSGHGNSWILSVFLHGESKFAYKADQPVATGTSNKFTHAMMWRGGKDWSLEFVDRKQWQLFKDLHEECFQRSVRAATVRHIPIPGVKPIQELPKTGVRFVRPYSKYIHQSEGEVEAALTSSRVIYDMDSEDEEWLNLVNTEKVSSRGTRSRPRIEEDTLEKVMDKLEKFSFVRPQHEPLLTSEVAAEICQTLGSQEAIRAIHGHWYDKRNRKGMALVRHFQPAPWEQYQRLLEDWQMKVNQLQEDSPTANKQQLQSMCKRPPLFAFCLRPRGLENRNKMQKQRSQRKQGLGGSSSRQWTLAGPASDFFLDSPSKRPTHFESSSGPLYGSRKYGRQRISEDTYTESMAVDLSESFNALASAEGFISSTFSEQVMPIGVGVTFSHAESSPVARTERTTTTRPHKKKKAGRKARKMRLLASAEESKRKRQLRAQQGHVKERFLDMVHSPHSLSQFVQPSVDTPSTSTLSFPQTDSEDVDLEAVAIAKAAEAKRAREEATAKRLRAQALYAVADAAMHKAVAAVIAADAIHASERAMEKAAAMSGQGVEFPEQTGEVPVKDEGSRTRLRTPVTEGGTSFGSWRRALNSASRNANHVLSKGTSSKQGLLPDTDDPLLPVASWSQELGAGLGTRLLQTGEVSPQRQRYSPVLEGLSKSPTRGVVSLGRTRGESMMAMLTR
ncbi:hypothetical protein MPTK1_8g09190 [Marchantia polymorpha subsp. ruderalis]|uniref:Enhancer of polycomb-like protein n=2 Tax=Marchantia polymorpha TaxID=3197 RepID=A0A2R6W2D8_MARPO|nr:hypothetical protein MARPO_0176s0001 [Marchantia polymorpha]BBN19263.1 hypothetical protein Mp_8g09190 [Marchantia polymorpha subsp. ruderalis]|eukprot:PTQ28017.1 hypothetical protein MARPO_0176s0001 [Marchantia polymorpha]